MNRAAILAIAFVLAGTQLRAASYYPLRLDDPEAVYLTPANFPVHGDGAGDDTDALQAGIDRAAEHGGGILFVPSGRYRISHTVYVWPAVRVIGYGPTRPVFFLGDNTPGYQHGIGYMFLFAGGRRRPAQRLDYATGRPAQPIQGTVPPDASVADANPGTFYSAMSNADIEIGGGNPAAVAIRFHVAQHSYLAHMDFRIGSGLAALKDIGNEAEDLHIHGGQYGIVTVRPSPGWQFTLLDSSFDGQSQAAIQEHEAGLTLIHDNFRDVPHAISIDPGYSEELWVEHARFESIGGAAIVFGNEDNPRTEINLQDVACRDVKVFAELRGSDQKFDGPADRYIVTSYSHGLTLNGAGDPGRIATRFDAHPVAALPAFGNDAIAALPPASTWVNLKSLGVKGDGVTDDTAAIQQAIEEHPALYVPMGRYLVTDTIHMRPGTVLIGLHPSRTQFDLKDESPGFQGIGAPRALLESSRGGHNIVTGIGLFTGGINDRAVAALWKAGAGSLMDDVRFLGGHGTNGPDGRRMSPYNSNHTADPNPRYRWDAQYPSLWITDGGGGTFADIWTPDTFAEAGMLISNTSTPGRVYELSCEHHVRNEVRLDHVENWEIDALQTEEERGESGMALPLEIDHSRNITFANDFSYRVISSYEPFPYAVRVSESSGIRFRNMHVYSNSKVAFDDSVIDSTHHAEVRAREFAALDLPGGAPAGGHRAMAAGQPVQKLATGFFSLSGGATDADGTLYFVDTHWQRIYRWDAQHREAVLVSADALEPENLALAKNGNLLVVSRSGAGTVYTFPPQAPDPIAPIEPQHASGDAPAALYLPTGVWTMNDFAGARPWQYVSPDGSTAIASGDDFVKGHQEWGTKMADLLRTFGLQRVVPGHPFYITAEAEETTYRGSVTPAGSVEGLQVFTQAGGESVAQDANGRVYLAAGQILVYSPQGQLLGRIDVPERPIDLVFGGADHRTLYILAHHSLYALKLHDGAL
ncbi:MAG: glycosyl hydrolase family 28-related protein [Acidobacteriota bacterium]